MTLFALQLEHDDGTITEIPIDFDEPTPAQSALALHLWDKTTTTDLAAARIFARTGRPVDDWDVIGPVLRGLIEGDDSHVEIRDN